jgi:hypothetical protein
VGAAPLPGRARQGRADRLGQAAVGVAGDQGDAGQAAGGQVPEEPQPARAVLGAGDLQAQDFPVPVCVHPGRQQRVHVDHPAALADLQHQRIGGRERVRAGAGGRVRNASTWSSRSRAISLTCDRDSRVMPRDSTSFSIRRVDTPSR